MRKLTPLFLTFALTMAVLTGCSSKSAQTEATAETKTEAEVTSAAPESETSQAEEIRIGSMKGPTSMGLVALMNEKVPQTFVYDFQMVTAADELLTKMVSKEIDIALVPANIASVLYNKTEGGISVLDINTLGNLNIVSSDTSIQSIADLKGKTIYMTGKGTTPDYVINYLLAANGMSKGDVTIEYKSEATEVAAVLKEQDGAIGLLPQPFVTVACAQNSSLSIVLDLTSQWDKLQGEDGSRLVTGVTVVRNDFLMDHEAKVTGFLKDHKASAAYANENVEDTAQLIEKEKIVEKAAIAKKALPFCNITYIDGQEMKTALSGYLKVLFDQDPKSVGGALPADDFYY